MIYLINSVVSFNPENGSLKNVVNNREVFLSSLNARILHQLINAGSDCLRREELLQQAWQQHGLIPAPATLNQYISVTRRTLVSIGLQERLIITVAKTGYRLNNSVNIETVKAPTLPSTAPIPDTSPTLPDNNNKKPLTPSLIYNILTITLLIIAGLLCFLISKRYLDLNRSQSVIYAGKIKGCPIYFIKKLREKDQENYLRFLATTPLLEKGCLKDEIILAHANRRLNMSEGIGHQFMAKCSIDTQGNYYHCENQYHTLWQSK